MTGMETPEVAGRRSGVDWGKVRTRTLNFCVTQFLLISYLIAITIALAAPAPGRAVGSVTVANNVRLVQSINIIIVFFITGLVLKTNEVRVALRQRLGVVYGFVTILGITPCLGFAFRVIPLTPSAFAAGLALFCTVPTTLGVGVSLVRACRGNEALALLLTVGTNVIAIFLMPLWLKALFNGSSGFDLHVDFLTMFLKLLVTVLVPSVLGKAMRDLIKPVERFANAHRTGLGLFSTANLACIVWIVLSGARDVLLEQRFVNILYVILLAVAQHLLYLAFNFVVVWYVLRMPAPEAVATGLMSSQKSSPVAVTVISYITSDVAQQGLMAIPALVGQIFQVFIGSALVPIFSKFVKRWEAAQGGLVVVASAGGAGGGEGNGGKEAGEGQRELAMQSLKSSAGSDKEGSGTEGGGGEAGEQVVSAAGGEGLGGVHRRPVAAAAAAGLEGEGDLESQQQPRQQAGGGVEHRAQR